MENPQGVHPITWPLGKVTSTWMFPQVLSKKSKSHLGGASQPRAGCPTGGKICHQPHKKTICYGPKHAKIQVNMATSCNVIDFPLPLYPQTWLEKKTCFWMELGFSWVLDSLVQLCPFANGNQQFCTAATIKLTNQLGCTPSSCILWNNLGGLCIPRLWITSSTAQGGGGSFRIGNL